MRAVLFCGILLGCGSKPLPFNVPESGEYEFTGSLVELTCPDYLSGMELGESFQSTGEIEFLDDGGARVSWVPEICTHSRGTVSCESTEERPGVDPQTDTYWFVTEENSISWDSSTQGTGWQAVKYVCEGDDCDQYVGDCAEAYLKWGFDFLKTAELGEGDTALAE